MKKFISVFALTGLAAVGAQAKTKVACEKAALKAAYKIYDEECGGHGDQSSCEIQKSNEKQGKVAINVTCGFAAEPDYSDFLDVDLVLTTSGCKVTKKNVKDCYSD